MQGHELVINKPAQGIEPPAQVFEDFTKNYLLPVEGGYTVDTGGPTMWGITLTDWNRYAPKYGWPKISASNARRGMESEVTRARATKIYEDVYWKGPGLDKFAVSFPKTAAALMDAGVNEGTGTIQPKLRAAMRELGENASDKQVALHIVKSSYDHRNRLATNNPAKYGKYKYGWINRANSLADFIGIDRPGAKRKEAHYGDQDIRSIVADPSANAADMLDAL